MTSSTGWSGLIFCGSPPIRFMASRIAARSTTAGTPVKSWSRTRLGRNAISRVGIGLGVPPGEPADVVGRHRDAVLVAEQVLQQDLEREGQPSHVEPVGTQGIELVVLVRLPVNGQRRKCIERLEHGSSLRAFDGARPDRARRVPRSDASEETLAPVVEDVQEPPPPPRASSRQIVCQRAPGLNPLPRRGPEAAGPPRVPGGRSPPSSR